MAGVQFTEKKKLFKHKNSFYLLGFLFNKIKIPSYNDCYWSVIRLINLDIWFFSVSAESKNIVQICKPSGLEVKWHFVLFLFYIIYFN